MNPLIPDRRLVLGTATLLLALVAPWCVADDEVVSPMDTSAYQLLQLLNQNEALSSEISGLRGQVEELTEKVNRDQDGQQKIAVDFDTRIANLEAKPEVDTSEDKFRIADLENRIQQLEEAITAMRELVMSLAQTPATVNSAETGYEAALEKYRAGNYEGAVLDLQAFLQLFGEDTLAPNARYWLAEALLRQGNYTTAIETGEYLLIDYPGNEKAPDTMFLIGKAYLELGDIAGARSAWEELVTNYPQSEPATKVLGLLDQLP